MANFRINRTAVLALFLAVAEVGYAQTTLPASGRQSDEKQVRDAAAVQEWAAKGKPTIRMARSPSELPQAAIPAFPGAWGGGMYSHGGRGGKVFVVTSLDDAGPGTFREALEAVGPRIVIFNVAGLIDLKTTPGIRNPYITINGATAPGDGVCIGGAGISLDTHDIVIRHMRFRGARTGSDAVTGNPVGNVIVDHVSTSWGQDENMSIYRHLARDPVTGQSLKLATVNVTIQNSIFAECMKPGHEFGSTIGGHNSTFYFNLWANNVARNPSVGMDGDFTLVSNVMYNWAHRTVDGGDHNSRYNIINNYFKPGAATRDEDVKFRILRPEPNRDQKGPNSFGRAYVDGNVIVGNEQVTKDNWAGGVQLKESPLGNKEKATTRPIDVTLKEIRVNAPFKHAAIPQLPAADACTYVLANVGATRPKRDAVDLRVMKEVTEGKPTFGNGIVHQIAEVGGYPAYKGTPYPDADKDGLPDAWETKYGLNPNDPADAAGDTGDGYSNVEKFINGIDPTAKTDWKDLANNRDLLNPKAPVARP